MNDFLYSLDWVTLFTTILTVILIPIGKQVYDYLKMKKVDKYAVILYEEVVKAVKSVYETVVKDIKGTSDWTPEMQEEVKEIAKRKALSALSNSAYRILKTANTDFELWLDNMIGTALYDVKHEQSTK